MPHSLFKQPGVTLKKQQSRLPACVSTLLSVAVLSLNGCDKIPTWAELTGGAKPVEVPVPVVVAPAPQPVMREEPKPTEPPPVNPVEVLARFRAKLPREVTDNDLAELASLPPEALLSIEELNLNGAPITNAGLAAIERFPALKSLNVEGTRVTEDALASVAKVASLEKVIVNGAGVTDKGVSFLKGLANVKELGLRGAQLTPQGFSDLSGMGTLEKVNLSFSTLNNATMEMISNLRDLRTLEAAGTGISDDSVVGLKNAGDLYELDLSKTAVNGESLLALVKAGKCKNIRFLAVQYCPLNIAAEKAISQMRSLEELFLQFTAVDDNNFAKMVKPLANLKVLAMGHNKALTVRSMLAVKGLKNLEDLRFRDNAFGDDAFAAIQGLKNLQLVDATNAGVSLAAAVKLQKSLPDVEIVGVPGYSVKPTVGLQSTGGR